MNNAKLEKVMLTIGKGLEGHWGIKPEINQYNGHSAVILRNFVTPMRKNIPEENAEIIKNALENLGEVFNLTEWIGVIDEPTSNLVITYNPS